MNEDAMEPPICPVCGTYKTWEQCWNCGGGGESSLYDEDPLLYDEDDARRCDICDGDGGYWICERCAAKEVQP